jgi:hypothetical protein
MEEQIKKYKLEIKSLEKEIEDGYDGEPPTWKEESEIYKFINYIKDEIIKIQEQRIQKYKKFWLKEQKKKQKKK